MDTSIEILLTRLFSVIYNEEPLGIIPLPASGSDRRYFRISSRKECVIGAYNPDMRENQAFVYLSRHFKSRGLPVPQLLAEDLDHHIYLVEDLGDNTLFALLAEKRRNGTLPGEIRNLYLEVAGLLPSFQVKGNEGLDYRMCYPRESFDRQSMLWDLNYFKYYFLKLSGIPFDEQALEDDFHRFTDLLLQTPAPFFLYRDFQSRNIMLKNNKLYFIDYQGGRRGHPAYDLASLLYDAKANLPHEFRQELFDAYLVSLNTYVAVDRQEFSNIFYPYVYIRLMQALGAYGFRGYYEKKEIFLQSIPYALDNLEWLLMSHPLPGQFNALTAALRSLPKFSSRRSMKKSVLQVIIRSFSYNKGIPVDTAGHGGGFVFDCRALPNPGRIKEYQELSGRDMPVIAFLEKEKEVDDFLFNIFNIVDQSVKNYLSREFSGLTVNFGCTGGQHRSVYMAERLQKHLVDKFGIEVIIEHRELT